MPKLAKFGKNNKNDVLSRVKMIIFQPIFPGGPVGQNWPNLANIAKNGIILRVTMVIFQPIFPEGPFTQNLPNLAKIATYHFKGNDGHFPANFPGVP